MEIIRLKFLRFIKFILKKLIMYEVLREGFRVFVFILELSLSMGPDFTRVFSI
jgi:hypothetical protein